MTELINHLVDRYRVTTNSPVNSHANVTNCSSSSSKGSVLVVAVGSAVQVFYASQEIAEGRLEYYMQGKQHYTTCTKRAKSVVGEKDDI